MGTVDTGQKMRALVLATMVVLSVAVQPVGGQVIAGGAAAANTAGNAPAVAGNDATLDVATDSTLQVAYNVGNRPAGDYTVGLRGDSGVGPLDQTTPSDGQQGTVNLTVPAGVSTNFTATVLLNRNGSVEATDSFAVTVTNVSTAPPPASISATGEGYDPATPTGVAASYDAGERDPTTLTVEVANVTGGNDTVVATNTTLTDTTVPVTAVVPSGALAGDVTLAFRLLNGSNGVIASTTASYTAATAPGPADVSLSDTTYNSSTPTLVSAFYDGGSRTPSDLTVELVNATSGNGTVVAANTTLIATAASVEFTLPVGAVVGDTTVAVRLRNGTDDVIATDTASFGDTAAGGGETAPPPAVFGPETTQEYVDTEPLTLGLGYSTGGRDPANYVFRVVNATNGNGTVVARNASLAGTGGSVTFEIPVGSLSGNVTLDAELVNGTVVARNSTTFLASSGGGGGETGPQPAVFGPETTETYADDRPLGLGLAYTTGGDDPANYELRVINATNGNGTVVARNTSLAGTDGSVTFEIPAGLLSGDVELAAELVDETVGADGTVVARNTTTFRADVTPPTADVAVNVTEPTVGETVQLDAVNVSDDTGVTEYFWSVTRRGQEGPVAEGRGPSIQFTPQTPDEYTVVLGLRDEGGRFVDTTTEFRVTGATLDVRHPDELGTIGSGVDPQRLSNDLTLLATKPITFDRGDRYVIDVDRESQDAVSLVATETVSVEAFSRFALELHDPEGEPIQPLLTTFRDGQRVEVPLSVVSGSIPNESQAVTGPGVSNYSVTLRNASTDATVASTTGTPMVFDYAGELNATVDGDTVTFSIPRSSLGDAATARLDLFTGEPFESEAVLDGEPLRYDAATDTYRTTVARATLSENAYGYRVSFATPGDGQFDVSSSFAGPVALQDVRIDGSLTAADGSPVDGFVARSIGGGFEVTSVRNGQFGFTTPPGEPIAVTYYQGNASGGVDFGPVRDGVPDIYAVGAGLYAPETNRTLDEQFPAPSVLDVTVVDEDGDPVSVANARVRITHEAGPLGPPVEGGGWTIQGPLLEDGQLVSADGATGWELAGNVSVTVEPREGTRFTNQTLRRAVTMDENRSLRFELDEEDEPPTARLATNRSNPLAGQAVRFDASTSTDDDRIATGAITVTTPDGETIRFQRSNVTFTPSQSGEYTVTLSVTDRAGNTNSTQTTVDVRQPADVRYDFTLPSVVAGELAPDEPLVVAATVTNDGDVAAERTVALRVDGAVVAERTVSVGADTTETVLFNRSLSAGAHNVTVNERPPREVTVLQPATFAVNVTAGPTTVFTGEPVTVTARVTNTGGASGTTTVPFVVDGEQIERTVSVPGGETRTVSVTTRFDSADPSTKLVRAGSDRPTAITVRAPTNPNATLSVRSPRTGTATDASVSLAYNVTNVDTGIASAIVSVDGGPPRTIALANGTTTVDLSGLDDGEHTLAVSLVDNFGSRVATVERTVVLDTEAPDVTLESTSAVVGPDDEVTLNATTSDTAYANATARLYAGTDTSGTPVETTDLTDRLADGTATVPVDAVAGNTELDGTYTLEVVANDSLGRSSTATSEVEIDTTAPSVTVSSVTGGTTSDGTTYLNGSDTLSVTGSVSDGGAASVGSVEVVLVAQNQAFAETVTVDASGGSFDADVDVGSLSLPRGAYDVNVTASDTVGNAAEVDSGDDFTFDDAAPSAGVSVIATGANQVRLVVTSNETISGKPNVTLGEPDGSTQRVQVTDGNADGRYDATTTTDGTDGTYTGTVTVQDPAGNADTVSSTTNISTVAQFGADGNVTIETGGGTFVELNPDADTASGTSLASLTSSDTPLAALTENVSGDQFIEGEFGGDLSNENLTSATIGIPTDQIGLLDTVPADQLQIRRYNETTNTWNQRGTTRVVQNFDPDGPGGVSAGEYLLVTVTKFSTYGAVQPDTEAPTVDATSYTADTTAVSTGTFPYDTTEVTTTVSYSDDVSGVDASAVVVKVNGNDVDTLSNASASITDDQAAVTVTGVTGAGTTDVTVTVVDETGKSTTVTRSFTVETDDTAPTVSSTDLPATGQAPDTRRVPVTVDYTDPLSGVDTATVSVTVAGTTLDAANVTVDDTGVSFTVGDTKNGLLSPGDSRNVEVTVRDAAGNERTKTVGTVSVATDESGPTVDDTTYTADTSPVSGTTYPAETSRASVELSISDDFNGVDSAAITVRFGPAGGSLTDVTSSSLVTSSTVNYTATSLTPGTTYELEATLVDGEGNTRTVSRTVTVQPDTTAPRATSVSVTNVAGTTQPPFDNDVDGVSAQLSLTDNLDAVDPSAITVRFGPQGNLADVTSAATVTADQITYTETSLQNDTRYVLEATLVDTAGNSRTVSRTFDVGSVSFGGGGGGDPIQPPTAAFATAETVTAGETVTLDAGNSSDNAGIETYEWDFDGDGTFERTTTVPTTSYTFTETGTVTVTLRVVDGVDLADTVSREVRVTAGSGGSGGAPTGETTTPTPTGETPSPSGEGPTETATPAPSTPDETGETPTSTPDESADSDASTTPTTATDTATSTVSPPTTAGTGTATTAPAETTAARGPGFGSLVAVVALLAAALLALRRE
ncbi:beta strand repeat-containing protein [Halobaculum sp. MBLA0147]|uniref:beta strand repeat-containing protein n=1 Tax=Halobaculum sp. MBLA0147 TaxID=3079934 RepID=UPI003524E653